MEMLSPVVRSLLHSAGGDLFAARIALFNLNSELSVAGSDTKTKEKINNLMLLLDKTADTLVKITKELHS